MVDGLIHSRVALLIPVFCERAWQCVGGGLVAKSCPTLVTPWTVACQAPLSMGLSRQEYWSGLPFPSPGDFTNPEIKPGSPALAGGFYTTSTTWEGLPSGKVVKNPPASAGDARDLGSIPGSGKSP